MSELPRWFDREFRFTFSANVYPQLRVRLRGVPARLEELTRELTRHHLTMRSGSKWSIQENVGHLLDLEPLWSSRLDDFLNGVERLSPADLTNRRTHEAGHNQRSVHELLSGFRAARTAFVNRLEGLTSDTFERVALHPRLNQPMRLIDHLYFVAEHDDHHLARIWELSRPG